VVPARCYSICQSTFSAGTGTSCLAASRVSFDAAVDSLRTGISDLFAPYAADGRNELAFYPSKFRSPVVKAGADRKLMRLMYDGVTRIIEPYSLVFKRRNDGVGQEYFYAWDRTGGRSSGPGIKTLLNYKVQDLQILEETFEPKFEVTLAKAGDSSQGGYFTGSPGRRVSRTGTVTTRRRTRIHTGPTYVVQCSFCAKNFTRRKRNTRMNAHKNPWGGNCPGPTSFLVSVR
jgi:hypothetical protein